MRVPSLIAIEDIDAMPADFPEEANRILEALPETTFVLTARSDAFHPSWRPLLAGANQMQLGPLTDDESRMLLSSVGVDSHLIEASVERGEGNPLLLLELAEWHTQGPTLDGAARSLATILGADGKPLAEGDSVFHKIQLSAKESHDALITELAQRPYLMHELSPRAFEELVAELYARSGYEVELTPASKDGGVDIYARQRAPFGSYLTVIDCKRNRADRPVGVKLIRALYGTVMATDASVGVIATTSSFTKGAIDLQQDHEHRLGLQDFVSLKEMIKRMHTDAH